MPYRKRTPQRQAESKPADSLRSVARGRVSRPSTPGPITLNQNTLAELQNVRRSSRIRGRAAGTQQPNESLGSVIVTVPRRNFAANRQTAIMTNSEDVSGMDDNNNTDSNTDGLNDVNVISSQDISSMDGNNNTDSKTDGPTDVKFISSSSNTDSTTRKDTSTSTETAMEEVAPPAMPRERRLLKELRDIMLEPVENLSAGTVDSNLMQWRATIIGPRGSPYENGVFKLAIKFPDEYPFQPPSVYFVTPIYHCNIDQEGTICLDVLKEQWSPALTISKVLLSITSLLTDPNPYDPLEPDAATLYLTDREQYNNKAREYTFLYAKSYRWRRKSVEHY